VNAKALRAKLEEVERLDAHTGLEWEYSEEMCDWSAECVGYYFAVGDDDGWYCTASFDAETLPRDLRDFRHLRIAQGLGETREAARDEMLRAVSDERRAAILAAIGGGDAP
jgi:hypothetical protein